MLDGLSITGLECVVIARERANTYGDQSEQAGLVWRGFLERNSLSCDREEGIGGGVHLFLPMSWHIFGYSLIFVVIALGAALALGTYTQSESVSGEMVIHSVRVMPSRPGLVDRLLTREGAFVRAGTPLAAIRVEEIASDGKTGPEMALTALGLQDSKLQSQEAASEGVADSTRLKLRMQALGQRAAISALDRQIAGQDSLIESAVADLARVRTVAERGFISRRDIAAREDAITLRRQQLAALQQARGDKSAELNSTLEGVEEASSQRRLAQAQIAESRAAISRQRYEVDASRGYTLIAPISGQIAAVTASEGQPVATNQPLMAVVADKARMQAMLYVPTRAAGFLSVGQEVRLQVDAFPFATFGAVPATVAAISPVTIDRTGANGRSETVYPVTCSVPAPWVLAFGNGRALKPGMTLTAKVVIRKASLIEWLFEPIYAAKRR